MLRQKDEGNQRLVERAVSECTSLSTRCHKLQRDKFTLSASIQRWTDTLSQSISSTAAGDTQVSHVLTHAHLLTRTRAIAHSSEVVSSLKSCLFLHLSAGAKQYEDAQWLVQSAPVLSGQVFEFLV